MIYVEEIKNKKGKSYRYRVPYYVDGKRKFKTEGGFKTKKAARQAGLEMEIKLQEGYNPSADKKTVDDVWKEYKALEFPRLSDGTCLEYEKIYVKHIAPVYSSTRLQDLNYSNIQLFINSKSEYSQNYLKKIKQVFHVIVKLALKSGYIKNDPMSFTTAVSTRKTERKNEYIPKADFENIIRQVSMKNTFRWDSCAMAMYLGYYLGLRISEALAVQWSDIDFEKQEISISHQIYFPATSFSKKDAYLSSRLKTKESKAVLPIPPVLIEILKDWREVNPHELVCNDGNGGIIPPVSLTYVCGRNGFHFHQLRHTFITNVVEHCDPKTAASLARHSNVNTTLNIYTEIRKEKQVEVMKKAFCS